MNIVQSFSALNPVLTFWNSSIISHFPASKDIFITIDDGPNNFVTEEVIDALNEKKLVATFFVVGKKAESNRNLIEKILSYGFDVENHSYSHNKMTFYSPRRIKSEFEYSNTVIENITQKKVRYFRPPYGRFNFSLMKEVKRFNQKILLWNRMPAEFDSTNSVQKIEEYFERSLRAGDVIVLHDNEKTKNKIGKVIESLANVMKRKNIHSAKLPSV